MNASQTIFTVLFAISWGITSNVMARWKPFHYALWFCKDENFGRQALWRTLLSCAIFNILTLLLFGIVFYLLHTDVGPKAYVRIVLCGGLPGLLIPFGCYHLWLAIVHKCPTTFYAEKPDIVPDMFRKRCENGTCVAASEPDATTLGLIVKGKPLPVGFKGNCYPAICYIGSGLIAAMVYWWVAKVPAVKVPAAMGTGSTVRAIMGEEFQRIGENLQRKASQDATKPVEKPETPPVEAPEPKAIAPAVLPEENTETTPPSN